MSEISPSSPVESTTSPQSPAQVSPGRPLSPRPDPLYKTRTLATRPLAAPFSLPASIFAVITLLLLISQFAVQIFHSYKPAMHPQSVDAVTFSLGVEWITLFLASSVITLACGYRALDGLRAWPDRRGARSASLAIRAGWSALLIFASWPLTQLVLGNPSPFAGSNLHPATGVIALGLEEFVFGGSCFMGLASIFIAFSTRTHPLYRRNTVDEGIVSVAILLALAWIGYAILFHSDPSVQGYYAFAYFMMGATILVFLAPASAQLVTGVQDIDIHEKDGLGAALVQGSVILAIGLIFGGSVWGEADPHGDDEGGWWIPVLFFINGWSALVLLAIIGWRRVVSDVGSCLKNKGEIPRLASFAMYIISCGIVIFGQVSGDFYGWSHGLSAVLATGALLAVQELLVVRRQSSLESHNLLVEFFAMVAVVASYFWSESLLGWFLS